MPALAFHVFSPRMSAFLFDGIFEGVVDTGFLGIQCTDLTGSTAVRATASIAYQETERNATTEGCSVIAMGIARAVCFSILSLFLHI